MNEKESEDEPKSEAEKNEYKILLSGDLISFLNLFGRIINKNLGDIIGGK